MPDKQGRIDSANKFLQSLSYLKEEKRFANRHSFFKRFEKQFRNFQNKGVDWWSDWWQFIEIGNEAVVAHEMFKKYPNLKKVIYEKEPAKIDYYLELPSKSVFIEVKSINPDFEQRQNKGERPEFKEGVVSSHVDLEMDERSRYESFASRSKIIEYVIDFEKKLKKVENDNCSINILVFCTNKSSFSKKDLENFFLTYKNGEYSLWDEWIPAQKHYLNENSIRFTGAIQHFAFLSGNTLSMNHSIAWDIRPAPNPIRDTLTKTGRLTPKIDLK